MTAAAPLTASPAATGARLSPAAPPASEKPAHPLVGVVGGMGPLASAEFVRTVYRSVAYATEQQSPRMLLWSDPLVVDRTEAIESGRLDDLRAALEHSVSRLVDAGCGRVVVACVTAHIVLDRLPAALAARCVSLVDVVFDELATRPGPHLLLCTRGTARAGLFTADPRFPSLAGRLRLPSAAEQEKLHEHLYRLKRGADPSAAARYLREEVLPRHQVTSYVAGCTELHLLTGLLTGDETAPRSDRPEVVLDPLEVVARRITEGTL